MAQSLYKSDWANPPALLRSLGMPFWGSLKPTMADMTCLLSLFFDNLSTVVGVGGAFLYVVGNGSDEAKEILFQRIIPACSLMLFLGNVYFSWLATRMKTQFGRDFTANPYGINTVGAFPFVFGIMLPVVLNGGTVTQAWQAGVAGNFLVGLINIGLGFLFSFPFILKPVLTHVPIAALTIPVAGVGLTWLAINQITPNFATPLAGFIPLYMMFVAYFTRTKIMVWAKGVLAAGVVVYYFIPEVLAIVVPGYALGWAYRLPPAGSTGWTFNYSGGGLWGGNAFIDGLNLIGPYMGSVIPLAIIATTADLMCLVGAFNAGDPYPIGETLIADGCGTLIGAFLGSPFGTVVYFGHPIHKRIGGKYFFSAANGAIWLVLGLSGLMQLVLEITPKVAVGPIICIFGLMLGEECTKYLPQRHHVIIFFGIFFGMCDYFVQSGLPSPPAEEDVGKAVMRKSPLLISMIWCAMLVFTFDRKWSSAAVAACIGAFFSAIGLMHQDSMDMYAIYTQGFISFANNGLGGPNDPRFSCSPLQFTLAYLSIAAVDLFFAFCQRKWPNAYAQPVMQGTDEADEADREALSVKTVVIGGQDNWWGKGLVGNAHVEEGKSIGKVTIDEVKAAPA